MTRTDRYLEHNARYAHEERPALPTRPSGKVAVVACMDSRMNIFSMLGLEDGEAHVIRNAGGVVTDDVLRSVMISQRLLGTEEVILIHHTECGMLTFTDESLGAELAKEVGFKPTFALHAFANLEDDVRAGIRKIVASPFIPSKTSVRGFVYDVATGRLHEVTP